jgi:hypothetical protein
MPKQTVWKPWCPLGGNCRYANKHLGRCFDLEAAKRRLFDHLKGSSNHEGLSEDDARAEVEKFDFSQCREEETWEEPPPAPIGSRSVSCKSVARPKSPQRRRERTRSRSRSLRRPQLLLRDRISPARSEGSTLARLDEHQQNSIFQFAKAMGKCDAVIRTAARVCKQAGATLEDSLWYLELL